jgi:cytochrome c biogenesis protein
LLIFFGGALGAIFGFEGGMSIDEGTRISWLQHIKGSNGGMPLMRENGVPVANFLNLGFEVECEKFSLETYDGERPKAFRSKLNFYENDVKTYSTEITVNNPAVYKGITFYQASFNEAGPGAVELKVFRMAATSAAPNKPGQTQPLPKKGSSQVSPHSKDRTPAASPTDSNAAAPRYDARVVPPETKSVMGGVPLPAKDKPAAKTEQDPHAALLGSTPPSMLPGGVLPKVEAVEKVSNVKVGDIYRIDGEAGFRVSRIEGNLLDLGPAAHIEYFKTRATKTPEQFWIFKNLPGFDFAHRTGAPLHFVLEKIQPRYATGLSVAKDPGVWVVWIGCIILVAALFIALYTCHSRYWVAYTKEQGFVLVGWSNKLFLFEPRFEKFNEAFRKELKL